MNGNQVAIFGNTTISPTKMIAHAINGTAAIQISLKRVPGGATPCITNNRRPNGGVVKLISIANNMIMANHMTWRSGPIPKSKPDMMGKNIGTVSNIIASWSMNMPSNKSIANMDNSITSPET